ncbi:hypothetical protein CCHR01_04834 [Colletotrichum chrysophilum]|uniref:Uncharacterized protein n=1 Tax=Colletotrichum chrysophilum TaxID=1836956 RepID=A0AAD9ATS4_9PEZI|nr:hypothetical protein CCHR01_04834 [Colletotrichum chrysophilum]
MRTGRKTADGGRLTCPQRGTWTGSWQLIGCAGGRFGTPITVTRRLVLMNSLSLSLSLTGPALWRRVITPTEDRVMNQTAGQTRGGQNTGRMSPSYGCCRCCSRGTEMGCIPYQRGELAISYRIVFMRKIGNLVVARVKTKEGISDYGIKHLAPTHLPQCRGVGCLFMLPASCLAVRSPVQLVRVGAVPS